MTKLHTVDALRQCLPDAKLWDYGTDFNELWQMEPVSAAHAIVVWADTPADPAVRPVATEPHLTPFDWAIAACSRIPTLRVTVLDLRAEHQQADYAALRWLVTQRPECVPWLRRLVVKDLLDVSDVDGLHSLLMAPLMASSTVASETPTVSPQDGLKALPLCRVDLTRDASHHAIANLVGPMLMLRKSASPAAAPTASANHREALRKVLLAAGFVPEPSSDTADELAGRGAALTDILGKDLGELRLVLCDDQWHHGWLDWLCERTGTAPDDKAVQDARNQSDGTPRQVTTGRGISIWVSSGPNWLVGKLETLLRGNSTIPHLQRRLRLTDDQIDRAEILLLDLRLFAGHQKQERDFVSRIQCLHDEFNGCRPPRPAAPGGTSSAATTRAEPMAEALTLLPRTVALADPLLPAVLFSSTGRRDVIEMLASCPSVVTSFGKPRLLVDGTDDLRTTTEEAFDRALEEAVRFVRRRRAIGESQAARARVASSLAGVSLPGSRFKHVGIYIDESGKVCYPNEPFVMAAIVAMYPDEPAARAFEATLRPAAKKWLKGSDLNCSPQYRQAVAAAVTQAATIHGVTLRGVALVRGPSMLKGPTFGPSTTWANLALDRTHRVLLKEIVAASLLYAVQDAEIDATAECSVQADVRSLPLVDLGTPAPAPNELHGFGLREFTNRNGDQLWALLDPSGVYPIVDEVFSENRTRLDTLRISEARAVFGVGVDGHPLVEWADHLANTVFRGEKGKRGHPEPWARTLVQGAGIHSMYDEPMERLLRLARRAAEGEPFEALRDGVAEKAVAERKACSDKTPGGLADRCLAFVAEKLDAWRA